MSARETLRARVREGVVWDWSAAARGAAYAIPAAALTTVDVKVGAVLGIGVIPAAVTPLAASRRKRIVTLVLGVLVAASMLGGALLALVPVVAVVGIFVLSVVAALIASRRTTGMLALTLCLPLVAVGFSYPGWTPAAWLAAVIIAGAGYAWLISLAWPQGPTEATRPSLPARTKHTLLPYGIRVGTVGALCAAIGFLAGFEHVGWAPAAALLVMRPDTSAQRLRTIGRIGAVTVGALAAIACLEVGLPDAIIGLLVLAVVSAATATAASRWYLTAGFTTFLVFLLLLAAGTADASGRFWERVGETILGVTIAFLAGSFAIRE